MENKPRKPKTPSIKKHLTDNGYPDAHRLKQTEEVPHTDTYPFPPIEDIFELFVVNKKIQEAISDSEKNPKLGLIINRMLKERKLKNADDILILLKDARKEDSL